MALLHALALAALENMSVLQLLKRGDHTALVRAIRKPVRRRCQHTQSDQITGMWRKLYEQAIMPIMLSNHERSARDESRAPDGTLWWNLEVWPGTRKKFGGEPRICAWLWFNKEIGDTFTMRELRDNLGRIVPEEAEHFNRRLRTLRACEWQIPSNGHDPSIPVGVYRLDRKGERIWLKEESRRKNTISQRDRRLVFDRDGSRCKVCGVGNGESYPGEPGTKAQLTIGHRIPRGKGLLVGAKPTVLTICEQNARDATNRCVTKCRTPKGMTKFLQRFDASRLLNASRFLPGFLPGSDLGHESTWPTTVPENCHMKNVQR